MFKALLLTIAITLIPKVPTEPTFEPINGKEWDKSNYKATNPRKEKVELTVECMGFGEYEPVKLVLEPRTSETYLITDPNGTPAICVKSTWKPLK